MIYAELKKAVSYHLVAGIILGAIIISIIIVSRYEDSLLDTIGRFENIRINTVKMKKSTGDMDSAIKKINSLLPQDYYSKSHRELLLLALDDIKTAFKGSEIVVTNFDEKADRISLPVNIKIPVDNYAILVNRIGYLQSLNFPYFIVMNIMIEKSSDTSSGAIMCKLEGSLRMPAEKLKVGKK